MRRLEYYILGDYSYDFFPFLKTLISLYIRFSILVISSILIGHLISLNLDHLPEYYEKVDKYELYQDD